MTAIKNNEGVGLIFTKIIDELTLGMVDEDEESNLETNRDYWLKRGSKDTVEVVDELLKIIQAFAPAYHLKYNRFYIGLARGGIANNFVACKPKKQWVNIEIRLTENSDLTTELENTGLDTEYLAKWGKYRIRLRPGEVDKNVTVLEKTFHLAYKENEA